MDPNFHCIGGRQHECGWADCCCHCSGWSDTWTCWCYGMGRYLFRTKNTRAFYWWHFECKEMASRSVKGSWGLKCHSSTIITSCCRTIMHSLMLQRSLHDPWKLKTFLFPSHGQHTHQTCQLVSIFGLLWTGIFNSVFQFLPILSNFTHLLKRIGPTFYRPQSTTWLTLCKEVLMHSVREMVVPPYTDWFSEP